MQSMWLHEAIKTRWAINHYHVTQTPITCDFWYNQVCTWDNSKDDLQPEASTHVQSVNHHFVRQTGKQNSTQEFLSD